MKILNEQSPLGIGPQRSVKIIPGADGVDLDIILAKLQCEGLGQPQPAELASGVSKVLLRAFETGFRVDLHHVAHPVRIGFVLGFHYLRGVLDAEKIRGVVDVRDEIKVQLESDKNTRTSPEVVVEAAYVYKRTGWYGRAMAEEVIENLTPLEISALNYYQDDFFETNPILQMNIENFSISFNELGRLDDRAIQKVLREVDMDVLALALKKADEKVKQKIYRNMSAKAAALLKENMEFMGPVNQINIEEAQCKIIKAAMKLEREGEIVIVKDY